MKRIDLTSVDLDSLRRLDNKAKICKENRKFGACADVYEYQGQALKIFKSEKTAQLLMSNIELIAKEKDLETYNVVLPKNIIVRNGIECGYLCNIVNGYNFMQLASMDKKIKITSKDFSKAYNQALEDIENINKKEIIMKDSGSGNIMYDLEEKRFKFIDVDSWYVTTEERDPKVKFNLVQFRQIIEALELKDQFIKKELKKVIV